MDASDPEYPGTPPGNSSVPDEGSPHTSTIVSSSPASRSSGGQSTIQTTASSSNIPISLHDMLIRLKSHKQEIVDRVVLRLSSNSHIQHPQNNLVPQLPDLRGHQPLRREASQTGIMELESLLAQLREQEAHEERIANAPRALCMYNATRDIAVTISKSGSGMVEVVETLFPGVERGTLVRKIENRFKPTNIHRLLATEKKRAESQRVISIGGVEFEQAERDGKESEY